MKKPFLLPVILIVFSCSKKDQKLNEFGGLEKIDSIQVEVSPDLIFQDIDFDSRVILFLSKIESKTEVSLIDFDGKVIESFSLKNSSMDNFEDLLVPLSFQNNQSISAMGSNELISYSLSGQIIRVYPFPKNLNQQISKSTFYSESENKLLLLSKDILLISNKDLHKFDKVNVLENIDLLTGQSEFLFQFPSISIFRDKKFFFKADWVPLFMVDKDEIHIIFGIESVIYTFKINSPDVLLKSIPIHLSTYQHFEGYVNYSSILSRIGHAFSSGKISSFYKFDEYFLITYFPGFDITKFEKKLSNMSTEEMIKFIREMKIHYPNRMSIIDYMGNPLADFVPVGLDIDNIILRNGELWIPESHNLDVNKNIFKIYKLKVKA
jgi:hypothetical protein